jgi:hypothetical protein
MRNQARDFICSGLFPAISAGLLLSGCATIQAGLRGDAPAAFSSSSSQLDFMVNAMNATPDQREKLWRAHRGDGGSEAGRLRIALLESLPSHSGYDPAAAQRDLRKLAARNTKTDNDIRDLARLRLAELDTLRDMQASNTELQQRLDKIVAIERNLDRNVDKDQAKDNGGKPANIGR